MTRKTFNAVAKVLATADMPAAAHKALVAQFVTVFKASNPKFDVARFEAAAAPTEPYRCGDGKRFPTLDAATAHAGDVHRTTGNVIAVERKDKT